ncbi:MAG TPA: peptidoglycan editing factor PgeF [Anaerolineae bacterium]|nr:peptidoglycan editing factor PgeF [Anaerolineae bacterium]
MPFLQNGQLKYFVFDYLRKAGILHGIFTRLGGCSPKPWHTLNVATSVGDTRENVIENRRRIMDVFGRNYDSVLDTWQIHSNKVICSEKPRPLEKPHIKGDCVVTSNPDVSLMMVFADCVPILLYDPNKKVIGIAHAGWQGTVKKVAGEAIVAMHSNYGCSPSNIFAGIGPSVGPDHYIVSSSIINKVITAFPLQYQRFVNNQKGNYTFDLWEANKFVLQAAGVQNIEVSGICTACNIKHWYSHRAENGKTGRFAAVISLPM